VQARALAQIAEQQDTARRRALASGASDRSELLAAQIASTEAHLAVLEAAYAAQLAFGALEDAYRRPLQGAEAGWPVDAPRA
jgi:hypothetical protein